MKLLFRLNSWYHYFVLLKCNWSDIYNHDRQNYYGWCGTGYFVDLIDELRLYFC